MCLDAHPVGSHTGLITRALLTELLPLSHVILFLINDQGPENGTQKGGDTWEGLERTPQCFQLMVLNLDRASESPTGLTKTQVGSIPRVSNSGGLGQSSRLCLCNKLQVMLMLPCWGPYL